MRQKRLILTLSFLVTVIAGALAQNDAVYVYRNDGVINAFLKAEVDSMRCSQIELDGVEGVKSFHTCPDGNHPHAIDLGLPSGTKWCCCNVGASTPEGYGGYYAWGETSEKSVYNWNTYAFYDKATGYISIGSDISGTQYDVAHVRMGAPWRMPGHEQQLELMNNCSRQWTNLNGVNGILVIGPNGGQVFFPAAGYRWDDGLNGAGSSGDYWSGMLNPLIDFYAYYFGFSSGFWWDYNYRYYGQSVRPVCP